MLFCVVGTGRCGTTLLWEMLNQHPEVYVFRESHWIPKMFEFFGTGTGDAAELVDIVLRTTWPTGERVFPYNSQSLKDLFPDSEEIGVAAFCDRVGSMLARENGKKHWADKTPDYGPYMGMLQELWPSCRFIHLIRDGVAVARSMSYHPGFRWMAAAGEMWWVSASFNAYHRSIEPVDRPPREYGALWFRRLCRIRDEAQRLHPGSYLEVRFEDILENSHATLAQLSSFVGLEAPEVWLNAASSEIDWQRLKARSSVELEAFLGPDHVRLLKELGYPS